MRATWDGVAAAVDEMSSAGTIIGASVDAADGDAADGVGPGRRPSSWAASTSTCTTPRGSRPKSPEGWLNNFNIDLMSLVLGVDAAKEALADGGGSLISIGTTATAEHFAIGIGQLQRGPSRPSRTGRSDKRRCSAQRGVRCNVISPGPIFVEGGDWNMIKDHMADFYDATAKAHPGGQLGTPQDVADVAAFLASDRARHVNGVNVTVDGGFLKRIDF